MVKAKTPVNPKSLTLAQSRGSRNPDPIPEDILPDVSYNTYHTKKSTSVLKKKKKLTGKELAKHVNRMHQQGKRNQKQPNI